MTLPSFGSEPAATSSTAPPSFVTRAAWPPIASRKASPGEPHSRPQRHHVGLALARDDEAQPSELGMTLADFRDLLGPHEHALDLGGLVGAAHPALDAHVGAAAGARAGQGGREVAERKPDPGMIGIERGDDDLADVALGDGIAGAGPHDFQDQVLVDDHAFARRGLKGNQAEIGGAERLIGIDAARFDLVLQRFRKRRARHQRALDRGDVAARGTRPRRAGS